MRQRECGGIERGCGDKELRQWGGGVGVVIEVGALMLVSVLVEGLEDTGGCSTAHYGVFGTPRSCGRVLKLTFQTFRQIFTVQV